MTTFRNVLALILILMAGTVFAAPKGGGDGGPTDLMRGYYTCTKVSTREYRFEMTVQSATFIEPNDFDNTIDLGLFECVTHLERIDLLAAPYCQSDYLNAANLLMVCRDTREEMVGLLADLQWDVIYPAE